MFYDLTEIKGIQTHFSDLIESFMKNEEYV